ncbi:hypothetical protein MKW94_030163 [Papaver nudicaule]|uniref:Small ribosomal subunit protein uS10 domain-containing protein n=1 Tax=Papaver nudicaule TaxID=74823 RepID=A0AA41RZ75_PAPNU|nr:hypothetical protein [Papaver nudicaule]
MASRNPSKTLMKNLFIFGTKNRSMSTLSSSSLIRLPERRKVYTVNRSPHIDKKSREQFEMRIKSQYQVLQVSPHELHSKYFWLKRQRMFGAQFELQFSSKTRLDLERVILPLLLIVDFLLFTLINGFVFSLLTF